MIKEISTNAAPAAIGPYSQAIVGESIMCVSGQLPVNPANNTMPEDIGEQTRQSLNNLKAVIQAAGCKMSNVMKTTVYLSNIEHFAEVNEIYSEFFESPYPARAAFQVAALPKGAKIEIEAIVHIDI